MNDSAKKPELLYTDSEEASHIYLLPNSLTAGNLFFGFLAILSCIQANNSSDEAAVSTYFTHAVWFIFFGVVCDAFDGRLARALKQVTPLGSILDPIADKLCILSFSYLLFHHDLIPWPILVVLYLRNISQLVSVPLLIYVLKREFKVKPKAYAKYASDWFCQRALLIAHGLCGI